MVKQERSIHIHLYLFNSKVLECHSKEYFILIHAYVTSTHTTQFSGRTRFFIVQYKHYVIDCDIVVLIYLNVAFVDIHIELPHAVNIN